MYEGEQDEGRTLKEVDFSFSSSVRCLWAQVCLFFSEPAAIYFYPPISDKV